MNIPVQRFGEARRSIAEHFPEETGIRLGLNETAGEKLRNFRRADERAANPGITQRTDAKRIASAEEGFAVGVADDDGEITEKHPERRCRMLLVSALDEFDVRRGAEPGVACSELAVEIVAVVDAPVKGYRDGAALVRERLLFLERFRRRVKKGHAERRRPAAPVGGAIGASMDGRVEHPAEHCPVGCTTVELINRCQAAQEVLGSGRSVPAGGGVVNA